MEKLLKILGNCLIIIIILVCLPLAVPRILGIQEYNVISGSMEPSISVGSIVYVSQTSFDELKEDDVIAFDVGASVVTHRIVSKDEATRQITTKGDANSSPDFMPVAFDNVKGKVVAHIPVLGYFAGWLAETVGKIVAFILLIVGVLLSDMSPKALKPSKISLVLGLVLIFGSLGGFAYIYWGYQKSNDLYEVVETTYVTKPAEGVQQVPWYEMLDVDVAALQKNYPDVAGWIYIEGTDISYPIMFSGDDDTYLRTTIDKEHATAGSIFLEGHNLRDFSDSHSIIYGHNMRNLSMFGKLKYYKSDDAFYDEHKYFQIITASEKMRFEIFSYFDTDPASWVYTVPYYDNEEFQSYIDDLNRHSYIKTSDGNKVSSADKVVTLSTCSAQEMRFTVHGYLCDSKAN